MKTYTVIAISDIHMSNRLPFAKPTSNGMTDRLEDQIRLWEHVSKTAQEVSAKSILVLGDLFDKALVDPVTLHTTVSCIVGLPAPVYILPGNHDSTSVRGGRFATEAFGAMGKENIHALETGAPFQPRSWLSFWPVAYGAPEPSLAAVADMRGKCHQDVVNVLLAHHSITGCHHMGWTCPDGLDGVELCRGFSCVLAGHFHEHQRFGADLEGMYLGAPMHHRYDDVGRKAGYWVIKFKQDGAHSYKMIDPGLPKFHMLKDVDDEVPAVAKPGDFVRWRISSTTEEWTALRPKVAQRVALALDAGYRADFKHRHIPVTTARLAPDVKPEDGLRPVPLERQIKRYVKHVANEDERKRLTTVGIELLQEARHAG